VSALVIAACAYLAAGAATLAAMYLAQRRASTDTAQLMDRLLAPYRSRRTSAERILEDYVVPAVAVLIVLAVWPALVALKIRQTANEKRHRPRAFAVVAADLLERRTVAEIKSAESIHDPLGAVPAVPFGHLHRRWAELLATLQPTDELWSFRARWSGGWGPEEIRTGYAIVRGGAPGAYLLTARFPVERTGDGDASPANAPGIRCFEKWGRSNRSRSLD
jgi:hypothetical protein